MDVFEGIPTRGARAGEGQSHRVISQPLGLGRISQGEAMIIVTKSFTPSTVSHPPSHLHTCRKPPAPAGPRLRCKGTIDGGTSMRFLAFAGGEPRSGWRLPDSMGDFGSSRRPTGFRPYPAGGEAPRQLPRRRPFRLPKSLPCRPDGQTSGVPRHQETALATARSDPGRKVPHPGPEEIPTGHIST